MSATGNALVTHTAGSNPVALTRIYWDGKAYWIKQSDCKSDPSGRGSSPHRPTNLIARAAIAYGLYVYR